MILNTDQTQQANYIYYKQIPDPRKPSILKRDQNKKDKKNEHKGYKKLKPAK